MAAAAPTSNVVETFAGVGGNLVDNGVPYRRVTVDALLDAGLELHAERGWLATDLCRLVPARRELHWPLVTPSAEHYGHVLGWRVEEAIVEEVQLDEEDQEVVAALSGASSSSSSGGAGAGAGTASSPSLPPATPASGGAGGSFPMTPAGPSAASSAASASSPLATPGGAAAATSPSTATTSATMLTRRIVQQPLTDRQVYAPYRWMFSPPHHRAEALEDRLDEMTAALLTSPLAFAAARGGVLGSAAAATPGSVSRGAGSNSLIDSTAWTYGRVCLDADSGRLNAASVALELSRRAGGGAGSGKRMALDLREMAAFSVFPGQIIAVKGVAPTGDRLIVSALHTSGRPRPVQVPADNASVLKSVREREGSGPLRVAVAAGPYTDAKDVEFGPLQDLLNTLAGGAGGATGYSRAAVPDVLVLCGPFIDAEHSLVRSTVVEVVDGDTNRPVQMSYDSLWADVFLPMLQMLVEEELPALAGMEIVFLPSANDVTCPPVWPQWPLPRERFVASGLSEKFLRRITLLPNPCMSVIGDLVVAASTADALFAMNTELVHKEAPLPPGAGAAAAAARPDRFSVLCGHLLDQRSFFPLFPVPLPSSPNDLPVPLELTQLSAASLPCAPDLLLVPSRFGKPAVRVVGDATIAVNPGGLARNKTFARIAIFPLADAPSGMQPYVTNDAPKRVRVDIVKLAAS